MPTGSEREPETGAVDRVVLRFWKDSPHNPIALFPDMPERLGRVNSYQPVGQHGAADPAIIRDTLPCDPKSEPGEALLAELRRIGYRPRVLRRFPWSRRAA